MSDSVCISASSAIHKYVHERQNPLFIKSDIPQYQSCVCVCKIRKKNYSHLANSLSQRILKVSFRNIYFNYFIFFFACVHCLRACADHAKTRGLSTHCESSSKYAIIRYERIPHICAYIHNSHSYHIVCECEHGRKPFIHFDKLILANSNETNY